MMPAHSRAALSSAASAHGRASLQHQHPPTTPFPSTQSLSYSHGQGRQGCWDGCRGSKQHPKSIANETMAQKEQPPPTLTPCPLEPPQVTLVPALALRLCTEVGRLIKDLLTEVSPLALAITHISRASCLSPPCQV